MKVTLERNEHDAYAEIVMYNKDGGIVSACRLNDDDDTHRIFDIVFTLFKGVYQ